jgi:TolB-like protein
MTALMKRQNGGASLTAADIREAYELIIASDVFANAPRMCKLLGFLIEKLIAGDAREIKEYVIGIELFGREPSSYSTMEDPAVRVQAGRLRKKLKDYYAGQAVPTDIEISIPLGSYIPVVRRTNNGNVDIEKNGTLTVKPIQCIGLCKNGEPFAQGLHEELVYQLHKAFGNMIVVYSLFNMVAGKQDDSMRRSAAKRGTNHLIESSVRFDSDRIRASVRLVDAAMGRITWSQQFDRHNFSAIAQQEELASCICGALKQFLSA